MFCAACGQANTDGDKFCVACGRPLPGFQLQLGRSTTPARDSLEASVNRLGIPTKPRILRTIVVASFIGLIVQYLILPFVGIGALTGYDAGVNALLISLLAFMTSFIVAYKMRGGGGSPRMRAR